MELPVKACILLNILAQTIGSSYSIAYDVACVSNSECTDPNTYCKTSNSACAKGKCRCLEYMEWDSSDAKCKVKKYFCDRCNTTLTDCQRGSVCSGVNGQCICNGLTNNYYTKLGRCVNSPQVLKLIDEDCTTLSDCYVDNDAPGGVECVIPTDSSTSQKKCQCVAGYLSVKGAYCRKPFYGEKCKAAIGCNDMVANINGDTTIVALTCSADEICKCPTGSEKGRYHFDGFIIDICVTEYESTAKTSGEECDASNECESKVCESCPEDSAIKKCFATLD
ncbi:hypothetical protein ACF0H5_020985 [Mactra antiquata]